MGEIPMPTGFCSVLAKAFEMAFRVDRKVAVSRLTQKKGKAK